MRAFVNFLIVVLLVIIVGVLGAGLSIVYTDYLVKDITAVEEVQEAITQCQEYATPLVRSVEALSKENGALLERELQAAKVVNGLLEESTRLKSSLKEAVIKLQELNAENNKALEEINRLEFKVQTLESALEAINKAKETPAPTPPAPAPAPKVKTNLSKVA
jgi:predicted nuclease with TOPRIM domain